MNTLERLEELSHNNIVDKSVYEDCLQAYDFLMNMRFKTQTTKLKNGEAPNNLVNSEEISELEKATIKKIFSIISALQSKLSFDFKGVSQ